MKQKNLKKAFLIIVLFLISSILFLNSSSVNAFGNNIEREGYTLNDIKELISNDNQIEVYSEDGTMEIMDEPLTIDNQDLSNDLINSRSSTSFEEVKIVDSGKPDSESIVVTIMGDGFTATEQNSFINAANAASNYLIGNDATGNQGFYPYNLFRDYFTIYAIKVVSEESGVSRDASTNNGDIVNNYFGSSFYYGNNTSTIERALVITKYDKARALEKSGSSMTAIICNSSRWGGTGGEFAVLSMHSNFGQILTHEFGHSFGGLADEYWYQGETFRATEAVNKTQNGDLNTIKWKHWIGKSGIYSGIGAYRFSSNSSHDAYNWYKPHQNCQMQYSYRPFCAVCAEELIKRMEEKTGSFFETTNISDEQIKIDNANYTLYNDFEIPPVINGKEVVIIGQNAFKNQLNLTNIVIPNTVTNIDLNAFEGCTNLENVTLSNSLYAIGVGAFKGCASLESISIPNSVTHIDTSAFENCSYLQSVTLSTNLVTIGSSAFKDCASLESISIPNSVTHIDTSAFEGCSYLQSVTLSNNLIAIGSSAFKGCGSLGSITLPNCVANIDSSAFENCSYLQSVTLPTNLVTIGSSAFKGCGSLGNITIPSSVQYIDDEAFKNCSLLSVVTVNRRITNITNLGVSVFDGCNANLQIFVPTNRIAEYKNKEYWSSYRNKIIASEDYTEFEIDCEGNVSESLSLSKATNELYKLNVNCSKSYKINANSSNIVNIIIYDANMNVISSGSNTVTQFLGCGTYFISFEFDDVNVSGTFEIGISLTWTSSNILLNKGTNNIKNSMHLNNENVYHCSYKYLNNQGEGFYRFSLNVGSSGILPEGTIKIYSNINKTELLNRYGTTGINEQAITYNGENELYVFLPENGYYYIDIVLPKSTYSLITLTIEQIEQKDINYQNRLATIGFDELFDNKNVTNYFEKVTISHRSKIELDIVTSGTININIPIYIFEKHRDPGYEPGDNHYYLVLEYTNNITSINRSPIFTVILNPGTYYIGYSDNLDNASISFSLRRKVNTDLNIDGTLVTDPARNQGFPLGSEVTFNNGALLGNTITEGFTRNLYLMVEDRVNDPMSRLDYDWYSSNENIAIVTKYGTVLALNVNEDTTVAIYAINKDDPSIVYKKDFIILKETKTEQIVIECNMSYSYSLENGMYTLELDFTNSPYPYIGYYIWDIECFNGINVDMEHYGLVSSTGPGEALLTANYTLNMRIFLKIHLTITE